VRVPPQSAHATVFSAKIAKIAKIGIAKIAKIQIARLRNFGTGRRHTTTILAILAISAILAID
jgi:hypothetical protein